LRDLWTFESKEKMDAFVEILQRHEIPYQILMKGRQIASDLGMIVTVEEGDYTRARRLLKIYRRNSTNRNR
jgi:hypothetical protein